MQFDESANNQAVTVKANGEFSLTLPEVRTAGYRWTLKTGPEPACMLLEEIAEPNPAGVGGAGHHVWRFRGVAPGTCEIELHYARPWESSSGPAKTFRMKVEVRS
ncbi:MAG: protease inhibitor I42 family protein [Terriglobales bacterium]